MLSKALPRRPFATFRILDTHHTTSKGFVLPKQPDLLFVPDRKLNFKPKHGKIEVYRTNEDIQMLRDSTYVVASLTAFPLYCLLTNVARGRYFRGFFWLVPTVFLG